MADVTFASAARDLRHALSPASWARDALRWTPDEWQVRLLDSPRRRRIALCSRQSGKSDTAAILALHQATFRPGSLVLLLAPSLRQAGELLRKVKGHLRAMGATAPKVERENLSELELNGSRIMALPGDNPDSLRGISAPDLIILDEAAFVSKELVDVILPFLAASPNGVLVLLSTPGVASGFFYESWHDASGRFEKIRVSAEQISRITPDFLDEMRARLGPRRFGSEFMCEWLTGDTSSVFGRSAIEAAFSENVPLLPIRF